MKAVGGSIRVPLALGLFVGLACLLNGVPADGQAGAPARGTGRAVLERGPLASRGLPFFPPNLLPAHWGEYQAEGARVEVYFTREPLVLPAGWRAAPCGEERLLQVPGGEHADEGQLSFCLVEAGYTVFLSFPGESFPWCAWTQAFLQRLRYLLSLTQGSNEVPFPAIFDYRKD